MWGWHNLRHNFITYALNAGVPIHKVAAIVGHSTTAMTAGYADLTTPTAVQPAAAPALTAEDLIAGMSEAEKKKLARRLLGL